MEVIIIVAMAKNRVIGKDNDLIWHLPKDMKFFTQQTTGSTVIMGRKNYFSIPKKYRPLPNRDNVVLTRKRDLHIDDVTIFYELEDALESLKEAGNDKVFIIGGGQIYQKAIDINACTKMFITYIDETFEGDAFFPEFDNSKWTSKIIMESEIDEKNPHAFKVVEFTRN